MRRGPAVEGAVQAMAAPSLHAAVHQPSAASSLGCEVGSARPLPVPAAAATRIAGPGLEAVLRAASSSSPPALPGSEAGGLSRSAGSRGERRMRSERGSASSPLIETVGDTRGTGLLLASTLVLPLVHLIRQMTLGL